MKKIILILTISIFLNACAKDSAFEPINLEDQSTVGLSCESNAECEVPMKYMIQSNCPYQSLCLNSKCQVVCPLVFPNPNTQIEGEAMCKTNEDCNCEQRGVRSLECRCVNGTCFSVEEK